MNGGGPGYAGRFNFRGSLTAAKDFVDIPMCACGVTLAFLAEARGAMISFFLGHFHLTLYVYSEYVR